MTALSANAVAPVPPLETGIVEPPQEPADIVPAFVIPLSNVIALVIFPPKIVKSPSIDRLPDESKVALSVADPADVPDDPPLCE